MSSFLEVLQENAQVLLDSGAAALSDLQEQISHAVNTASTTSSSSNSTNTTSKFWRQADHVKEEWLAYLRWSTPLLQPNTHIPLPTHWDTRTLLALLDCCHSAQRTLLVTAADDDDDADGAFGSSSSLSIPPVTAALVSLLLLVFTRPGGVALRDVALSPYCVLNKHEYWRLLSCHLVHLDLAHLLTNLSALLPDCTALEEAQGPAAFTADLLLLGLAASTAYTAAALLQKDLLAQPAQYFSMVTVGASSLGFALKVWSGIRCRGGSGHRHHPQSLLGGLFPFPSQFAWAPNLALTHLLVPQASFTAHIAGVAAGLMRGYALQPVLEGVAHLYRFLTGSSRSSRSSRRGNRLGGGAGLEGAGQQQQQQQQRRPQQRGQDNSAWRQDHHRRFLDTQSSQQQQQEDDDHFYSSSSSSRWSWLLPSAEFLLQLTLLGAAVGVYVVCTNRSSISGAAAAGGQYGRGFGSSSSSSPGYWRRS